MPSHETSFRTTLASTVEFVTDISISKTDRDLRASHFCHTSTATFFSYSLKPFSGSGIRL